jgi:DNA-directed RNA polymerase omega subunit
MEIPGKLDSKFRFVLVAARRAEQIVRGAAPKLETAYRKPTRTAMQEIVEDRVEWGYGPEPTVETTEEAS